MPRFLFPSRSWFADMFPILDPRERLQHVDRLGWMFGSSLTYKAVPKPGVFECVAKTQNVDGLHSGAGPHARQKDGQMAIGMTIDEVLALGDLLGETNPN